MTTMEASMETELDRLRIAAIEVIKVAHEHGYWQGIEDAPTTIESNAVLTTGDAIDALDHELGRSSQPASRVELVRRADNAADWLIEDIKDKLDEIIKIASGMGE